MAFLNHEGNYSGPMEHIRAYGIPIQLIMIQVAGFAFDLGFLRTTSAPSIASLPTLGMRCGPWIWLVTPPDRAPGKCAMTHRASAGAGAICSCNCLLLTGSENSKVSTGEVANLDGFSTSSLGLLITMIYSHLFIAGFPDQQFLEVMWFNNLT